jgi:hypothetical protein
VTDMAKSLKIQVLPHIDAAIAQLTAFALHASMHLCISHECNNIFDFFLCLFVYAYVHLHLCMHVHVDVHQHLHLHVHTHVHVHVHMCIYAYACAYVYLNIYMYMYTHTYIYRKIDISIHVNRYISIVCVGFNEHVFEKYVPRTQQKPNDFLPSPCIYIYMYIYIYL